MDKVLCDAVLLPIYVLCGGVLLALHVLCVGVLSRCKIDWKKGKNVTVKTIKKKQKHKG